MNIALIVAGGSGLRMKQNARKQYLDLAGRPVIAHTLLAFEQCPHIDRIILVLPSEDIPTLSRDILPPMYLKKEIRLVPGGDERQDSVFNGLKCLEAECRIVAIHDGVRPFVTAQQISACILAAQENGASILGIPAFDTLKRVAEDGTIAETLDRRQIWLAQTPQAFRADLIKKAHQRARADNVRGTDDAALVERLGIKVKLIPGSRNNIKITTPEDLEFCRAML